VNDLRRIDVNLIVVLDAILAERNLTRAGDAVGLSQSAVSGALNRLRQQYSDELLVRSGRGFELTDKARELQPLVTKAMQEIERLYNILPEFDAQNANRVFTIATSDYVLSILSKPLLEMLKDEAPGVDISFEVLPTVNGISQIDLLRRDVMIAGVGTGIAGKRKSLFSDRFVCLVDAKNPRLRQNALSLSDLEELRMVRSSFGETIVTGVDQWLSESGVVPKVSESVFGFLPVPYAVANSTKYGILPEKLARKYADELGLVIAETPLPKNMLIEAVHWHPSKTQDPAIIWLVDLLRRTAEKIETESDE
jgi:DNA-binding transcriptional LysR family regulator